MFGFVSALIPLAILGAIIYAIVAAARRRTRGSDVGRSGDGFSVRRLFVYAMAFVALIVASIGLSGVLGQLLSTAAARADNELAAPLALTVVGVPVFAGLFRSILRMHERDAEARTTLGWALYVNASVLTAGAVSIGYAFAVADGVIRDTFEGANLAGLIVWFAAWALHWWAWSRIRPEILPTAQLWVASAAGLWIGAGAVGYLVEEGLRRLIEPSTVSAGGSGEDAVMAVAALAIGGAVWAWHWLLHGRQAARGAGWHAYVLIPGVLAGLVTAVVGVATIVHLTLVWLVGDPGSVSAASHFADAALGAALGVTGGGVWWYHRTIVGPTTSRERTEIDRVYDYLVSGVALVTVAVAVAILVIAFFEVIAPAAAGNGTGGGTNTLLAAVTALLVGAPMWALTWRRVHAITVGSDDEVRSPSRRTYLMSIFGVGGAVAFGALIALLVVVFAALFGESDGEAIARQIDVPTALLVTTAVIAAYHWMVYRAERERAAPIVTHDVIIVGSGALDLGDIARRTHSDVRLLRRLDIDNGEGTDADAIAAAIKSSTDRKILVVAGDHEVHVIPYA